MPDDKEVTGSITLPALSHNETLDRVFDLFKQRAAFEEEAAALESAHKEQLQRLQQSQIAIKEQIKALVPKDSPITKLLSSVLGTAVATTADAEESIDDEPVKGKRLAKYTPENRGKLIFRNYCMKHVGETLDVKQVIKDLEKDMGIGSVRGMLSYYKDAGFVENVAYGKWKIKKNILPE